MGNLMSKARAKECAGSSCQRMACGMLITLGGATAAFVGVRMAVLGEEGRLIGSSALVGAGVGAACFSIEKGISQKCIDIRELLIEVASSALTGVISGLAARRLDGTLSARITAGAFVGVASNVACEILACFKSQKQKRRAINSIGSKMASLVAAGGAGALGGAISHFVSTAFNSSWLGNQRTLARIATSGVSACGMDLTSQLVKLATGNQARYHLRRTLLAGTLSVIVSANLEAAKCSAYGRGRNKFLEVEANRQLIRANVPAEQQAAATRAYNDLNETPLSRVDAELKRAEKYNELESKRDSVERAFDADIEKLTEDWLNSRAKGDKFASRVLEKERQAKMNDRNSRVDNLSEQMSSFERPEYFGESMVHLLRRGRPMQAVCDIKDESERSVSSRIVFQVNRASSDLQFRFTEFAGRQVDFDARFQEAEYRLRRVEETANLVSLAAVFNKVESSDSD